MSAHELNIFTNDGWVVTFVADKPITLSDAVLSSVIVQPKENHESRIAQDDENGAGVRRIDYRLRNAEYEPPRSAAVVWAHEEKKCRYVDEPLECMLPAGHSGLHDSQPWLSPHQFVKREQKAI
jgi:hypothetical protein